MQTLTVTTGSDGIAMIAIDLPGRSMNVLTPQLTVDLAAAIEQVADTRAIRGAILTSSKADGFVAGADIDGMLDLFEQGIDEVADERAEVVGAVWRPAASHLRQPSTAWHSAAAWSWRWPAITAFWPTTPKRWSACRKSASACCRARGVRSACRA